MGSFLAEMRPQAGSESSNMPRYNPDAPHGTAIGLPISWGGARGFNVGIYIYMCVYAIHGVYG